MAAVASESMLVQAITKPYTLDGGSHSQAHVSVSNHETLHARWQQLLSSARNGRRRRASSGSTGRDTPTRLFDEFTMEGKQGHFPTGVQLLEVHVQDGQQAIPNRGLIPLWLSIQTPATLRVSTWVPRAPTYMVPTH